MEEQRLLAFSLTQSQFSKTLSTLVVFLTASVRLGDQDQDQESLYQEKAQTLELNLNSSGPS